MYSSYWNSQLRNSIRSCLVCHHYYPPEFHKVTVSSIYDVHVTIQWHVWYASIQSHIIHSSLSAILQYLTSCNCCINSPIYLRVVIYYFHLFELCHIIVHSQQSRSIPYEGVYYLVSCSFIRCCSSNSKTI